MSNIILSPSDTIIAGAFSVVGAPTIHEAIDEGTDTHDGDVTRITATTNTTCLLRFPAPNTTITSFTVAAVVKKPLGGVAIHVWPIVNGFAVGLFKSINGTSVYTRVETSAWVGSPSWRITDLQLQVTYPNSPSDVFDLTALEIILTPVGDLYNVGALQSPVIFPRPPIKIWPY